MSCESNSENWISDESKYGIEHFLLHQMNVHELLCSKLLINFLSFSFQHDRIYESTLLLNYYELPLRDQHLYRYFIKGCQKPALLTVGGMAPLNLSTCVNVRGVHLFSSFYFIHFSSHNTFSVNIAAKTPSFFDKCVY